MPVDPLSMLTSTVSGLAGGGPSSARSGSGGNVFDYDGGFNVGSGSLSSAGGGSVSSTIEQIVGIFTPFLFIGGMAWLALKIFKK